MPAKDMTENNKKQASCRHVQSFSIMKTGQRQGLHAENEGKYVICMPGPPSEMKPMFENSVKPFIQSLSTGHLLPPDQVIRHRRVAPGD